MKKLAVVLGVFIFVKAFAYTDVSAEEFAKLMKKPDAIILDVRSFLEYQKDGHIKGANLIPVQVFRFIWLAGLKDKTVLVYCRSGNRSVVASKMLEQMGLKHVYNLKGGILEWKAKNFPVEYNPR